MFGLFQMPKLSISVALSHVFQCATHSIAADSRQTKRRATSDLCGSVCKLYVLVCARPEIVCIFSIGHGHGAWRRRLDFTHVCTHSSTASTARRRRRRRRHPVCCALSIALNTHVSVCVCCKCGVCFARSRTTLKRLVIYCYFTGSN